MAFLSQIPNFLSLLRIFAVPYVFFCPVSFRLPFLILVSLTDFLDGYLARKLNAISKFGTLIDPIGDKAMALAFAYLFWSEGMLLLPQVMIFFAREWALLLFVLCAVYKGKWGEWRIQSFWCGKVATALQAFIVGFLCLNASVPPLLFGLMALSGILALPELIYRMSVASNVKMAALLLSLLFIPSAFAIETNFIAIDAYTGAAISTCGPSIEVQVPPCSTFKIALSLIGYDCGMLHNKEQPVWLYPGSGAIRELKTSACPSSWMDLSLVWYSKLLMQRIGRQALHRYVWLFSYGNKDISGSKDQGYTACHLSSSLKISPKEQVCFIKKIVTNRLPVSAYALGITKQIVPTHQYHSGWKVIGKTGSGYENDSGQAKVAWCVGWVEKQDQVYPYALLLREIDSFPTKEERLQLVIEFFRKSGMKIDP
jgi:beta-lactamase class D/phosphatidylglycerophosphate synthase